MTYNFATTCRSAVAFYFCTFGKTNFAKCRKIIASNMGARSYCVQINYFFLYITASLTEWSWLSGFPAWHNSGWRRCLWDSGAHGWQWFFCCCFALSLLTDWLISSWRSRYHLDATESEMLQGDFMNQDNCSQVIWPDYICLAFNLPWGVSVSNNIDRADVWQNNEQWLLQQFWHQIFS